MIQMSSKVANELHQFQIAFITCSYQRAPAILRTERNVNNSAQYVGMEMTQILTSAERWMSAPLWISNMAMAVRFS